MEEGPPNKVEANSEASSREELVVQQEDIPEGKTYPLNSKRIVSDQLQVLAKVLGLPGSRASMEETRQLIEGRLLEMGHEPRNVQVIINDEGIFLIDDTGIITSTEHVSEVEKEHVSNMVIDHMNHNNVISHHNDVNVNSLSSALCEARCENESLTLRLYEQGNTVTQLQTEMGEATETIARLEDEIWKEKAKVKWFWSQQCKQLALHEATLQEKDKEIASLRERLARLELIMGKWRSNDEHTYSRGADVSQTELTGL